MDLIYQGGDFGKLNNY